MLICYIICTKETILTVGVDVCKGVVDVDVCKGVVDVDYTQDVVETVFDVRRDLSEKDHELQVGNRLDISFCFCCFQK